MSNEQLADLTQPQRDRLAFVELRVRFIGEIRRQDLVTRFGIQSAAASRDLAPVQGAGPGNIDYDPKGKSHVLGPDFQPVFDFPGAGAVRLTQGFGDGSRCGSRRGWPARARRGSRTGSGCAGERDPGDPPGMSARHRVPLHLQWPHWAGDRPVRADRQRPALARPRL